MALAAGTLNTNAGGRPSAPLYVLDVSIVGISYLTGGMAGFAAAVEGAARAADPALKISVTKANIMGIIPIDWKGYQLAYDKSADKLMAYWGDNDNSADGPGVQVANATDLTGVTFRMAVLVQ